MKGSLLNCGDGKESHTEARTCCCPCRWKSKVAAFECLGYTELHIWFLCGVVCVHVCDSWNQIWFWFCLAVYVFSAFFLCLVLLDLAEKNKWDHVSTIFKLSMKAVNAGGMQADILGLFGAVSYLVVTVLVQIRGWLCHWGTKNMDRTVRVLALCT